MELEVAWTKMNNMEQLLCWMDTKNQGQISRFVHGKKDVSMDLQRDTH